MAADPKHLPPRDCLVLIGGAPKPTWHQAVYSIGHDVGEHVWTIYEYSGEVELLSPEVVITWRELPEVG